MLGASNCSLAWICLFNTSQECIRLIYTRGQSTHPHYVSFFKHFLEFLLLGWIVEILQPGNRAGYAIFVQISCNPSQAKRSNARRQIFVITKMICNIFSSWKIAINKQYLFPWIFLVKSTLL